MIKNVALIQTKPHSEKNLLEVKYNIMCPFNLVYLGIAERIWL